MFNDNVSPGRTKWTYTYKGKELLNAAITLHREFETKESEARNTMAGYMKDMKISNSDPKGDNCKDQIRTFGTLKEQCTVFKHEFNRNPEKEYELGLGDVTFFGLAKD